jgi:hypothetical protein
VWAWVWGPGSGVCTRTPSPGTCSRPAVSIVDPWLSAPVHPLSSQRGMEHVLNADKDHPEMLALYVDMAQRRKGAESENEEAIQSCLEVLRYLAVSAPEVRARS